MKTNRILLIAVLIALFVSTGASQYAQAAPTTVAAGKRVFTVINKTNQIVDVKLTGTTIYNISVEKGDKESVEVDEDTYTVEYTVCGNNYNFNVDLTEKGYTLTLYPCAHQPSKMQVKSHLSEDVVLKLFGYENYSEDIQLGKNKVELFSGNYVYAYDACGITYSGEVFVNKAGTTQFVLHSCEWYLHPARFYGQPNPVKFRIVNQASFPFILTLIGPENYLVTANPGVNRFTLVSGSYKYSYYLDYALHTGTMLVTKNGIGILVLSPSYVYNYVDEGGLD